MGANNLRNFKRFIVVDESDGMPVAFDGDQFCYCSTERWKDTHWPVQTYSFDHAKKLIKKSAEYRKRMKYSEVTYLLMPIKSR